MKKINIIKWFSTTCALTLCCAIPVSSIATNHYNVSVSKTGSYYINYQNTKYDSVEDATKKEISNLLKREKVIGSPKINAGSYALNLDEARIYDLNKIKKAYRTVSGNPTPDFEVAKKSYTNAIKEIKYYDYNGKLHESHDSAKKSILNSTSSSGMGIVELQSNNDKFEFNPLNKTDNYRLLEYILNNLAGKNKGKIINDFSYDYFYKKPSTKSDSTIYNKSLVDSTNGNSSFINNIVNEYKQHLLNIISMLPLFTIELKFESGMVMHNKYRFELEKDKYDYRERIDFEKFKGYFPETWTPEKVLDGNGRTYSMLRGASDGQILLSTKDAIFDFINKNTYLSNDIFSNKLVTNGVSLDMLRIKQNPWMTFVSNGGKWNSLSKKLYDCYWDEQWKNGKRVAENLHLNWFGHKLSVIYDGDCSGSWSGIQIGIMSPQADDWAWHDSRRQVHFEHELKVNKKILLSNDFKNIKNEVIEEYVDYISPTSKFHVDDTSQKEAIKDFLNKSIDTLINQIPNKNAKYSLKTRSVKYNDYYSLMLDGKFNERFWLLNNDVNRQYDTNLLKLNDYMNDNFINVMKVYLQQYYCIDIYDINKPKFLIKNSLNNMNNLYILILYKNLPLFELDIKELISNINTYNLKSNSSKIDLNNVLTSLENGVSFPNILNSFSIESYMLLDSFKNISNHNVTSINNYNSIEINNQPIYGVVDNKITNISNTNTPLLKYTSQDETIKYDLETFFNVYNSELELKNNAKTNLISKPEDIILLRDDFNQLKQITYKEYVSSVNDINMGATEVIVYDNKQDLDKAKKDRTTLEPLEILYLRDLDGNIVNKDIFNPNGTINIKNYSIYNPSELVLSNIAYTYAVKSALDLVFYENEDTPIKNQIYNLYKLDIKNNAYYFYQYDDAFAFLADYIKNNSEIINY